jgi:hypothetical protein
VEEMSSAGADSQVIVFSGTMHGFTHEEGGNKTPGAAYHPIADARSRSAMRSFCNELFPGPIGPGLSVGCLDMPIVRSKCLKP